RPLDDRDRLPGAEIGLPGGATAVRAHGPAAEVPGGLLDRGLADVVRLPPRPERTGDQLRGGLRARGMEVGAPGGAEGAGAEGPADPSGDGADGGATGRVREPEARR